MRLPPTGGEPNAGDHGQGEDGVHHFLLRFGSRGRRGRLRCGAECSTAGVGWATVQYTDDSLVYCARLQFFLSLLFLEKEQVSIITPIVLTM